MIVKYFIGPLETNGLIGIKIHFGMVFVAENIRNQKKKKNRILQSQLHDAVIVGAGFAGMYMLHRLRELG